MADHRNPKGSSGADSKNRWIGIAVAAVVLVLLIAWWTGAFDGPSTEPVAEAPLTEAPTATTTDTATEGQVPATTAPAAEQPAEPAKE